MLSVPYGFESFTFLPAFARRLYSAAVRANSPHQTIQDLMNAAKSYRTTFGAVSNIDMVDIARFTGARFQFMPFDFAAEAVTATLGGHVGAVIQNRTEMLPALQSGRLRLLASAGAGRWKELPGASTPRDQGIDVAVHSVIGLVGPKGIPQGRLEVLIFGTALGVSFTGSAFIPLLTLLMAVPWRNRAAWRTNPRRGRPCPAHGEADPAGPGASPGRCRCLGQATRRSSQSRKR